VIAVAHVVLFVFETSAVFWRYRINGVVPAVPLPTVYVKPIP
jgi:hypothetical protein